MDTTEVWVVTKVLSRLKPLLQRSACLLLAVTCAPACAVTVTELALVINTDDPISVALGAHYQTARGIPTRNVLRVRLGAPRAVLSPEDFARVWAQAQNSLPASIQAYALAWTLPYRVGCMSITTAFAMGYGTRFCAEGCKPTAPNPLYNQPSRAPFTDFRVRPAMLLAASTLENSRQVIARGVQSDGLQPQGRAYLVRTPDQARSSRAPGFAFVRSALGARLPIEIVESKGIRNRFDVLFYFTGTTHVPYLETLGFLPGAVGDHLTSAGGQLDGTGQMSALRWLEAGATGSYGAVVEPCNFPQKFPNPGLMMKYYLDGNTLIEAYWKSVVWPGQGVFIGEPLAAPFTVREN
jgi:uncharacterized protein (TIGR03790 family)